MELKGILNHPGGSRGVIKMLEGRIAELLQDMDELQDDKKFLLSKIDDLKAEVERLKKQNCEFCEKIREIVGQALSLVTPKIERRDL